MSISNIFPISPAITSQMLQGQSGIHRYSNSTSQPSNSSTQISPLSTLMNAFSSTSSTALSTVSSLMNSLPGFAAKAGGPSTNFLV